MCSDPIEFLARVLFEEMNRLAPGSPEDVSDWGQIGEWDRLLYINCIERLLEERKVIERALQLANDDPV